MFQASQSETLLQRGRGRETETKRQKEMYKEEFKVIFGYRVNLRSAQAI